MNPKKAHFKRHPIIIEPRKAVFTAAMRTCVSIAAALALASCADAFCASPAPAALPRTTAPLSTLSMVGTDYYHGQAAELKRRQAAKRVPYGGYNPETRVLQSAPAALYPAPKFQPYVGYDPKDRRALQSAPLYDEPVAATVSRGQALDTQHRQVAKFGPYSCYNPETRALQSATRFDELMAVPLCDEPVAAPASTFDAGASERAQHEIDELHRIAEDFMKRLDAAGAQNNIVHSPRVSVPTVAGLL